MPPDDPGSLEALVDRVASSSTFQKSNRLRQLLLFLCQRALSNPGIAIHESGVGIEVFGRQPGYDTAGDPLVRVQVSQLRKKLQQHFAAEGGNEPVVIEIPKGAYTPVFVSRQPELPADSTAGAAALPGTGANRWKVLFAFAVVLGAAAAAWGVLKTVQPRPPGHRIAGLDPTVDRLWERIFVNGRPSCVVLSDYNLVMFQETIRHQLSLNDYRNKDFDRITDAFLPEPALRPAAKMVLHRYAAPIPDAQLAGVFSVLNAAHQLPTEVFSARDFMPAYLQSHNVIMLGSRRANPWVELFEAQLNFRTVFQDGETPVCYFQNQSPSQGESATYRVDWGRSSYCRVAFLPNPTRSASILLISGTDVASTEAGGQFITSERWTQALHSALHLAGDAPIPHFEVLLKVEYVTSNTAPRFSMVSCRVRKS